MKQGRVVSVNVGVPREVSWRNRTFTTAIVKTPVLGIQRIEGVNVVGDLQADLTVHGGSDKAVYAYSLEDYAWWNQVLDRQMPPAVFGDNLTTEGVDLNALAIGEQWRIGSALLEVSEPRIPCYKLGYRMDDPAFPKQFAQAMRFGAYFRILEEGEVMAGSQIIRLRAVDEEPLTIQDVGRIYLFAHEQKYRLSNVPALGRSWRQWASEPN